MTDHSGADEVVSGVPYAVTAVNGQPPGSLDDFGCDVVEVVVSHGHRQVTVRGSGQRVDVSTVVIHEKTFDGTGKDVRTWQISAAGEGFEATERSVF